MFYLQPSSDTQGRAESPLGIQGWLWASEISQCIYWFFIRLCVWLVNHWRLIYLLNTHVTKEISMYNLNSQNIDYLLDIYNYWYWVNIWRMCVTCFIKSRKCSLFITKNDRHKIHAELKTCQTSYARLQTDIRLWYTSPTACCTVQHFAIRFTRWLNEVNDAVVEITTESFYAR